MKDSTLLKIALVTGLVGILALFIIMKTSDIKEYNLSELENIEDGKTVKIIGIVEKSRTSGMTTFIEINQTCSINAIIFDNASLLTGQKVELTGKTTSYEGKKELIVDKIKTIS